MEGDRLNWGVWGGRQVELGECGGVSGGRQVELGVWGSEWRETVELGGVW